MVLWMLFFAVYSAIWPTFPIAPDMLGQASRSASLLVIHFHNVVIGVDVGPALFVLSLQIHGVCETRLLGVWCRGGGEPLSAGRPAPAACHPNPRLF